MLFLGYHEDYTVRKDDEVPELAPSEVQFIPTILPYREVYVVHDDDHELPELAPTLTSVDDEVQEMPEKRSRRTPNVYIPGSSQFV